MSIEINPAYGETRAVEAALLGRRITDITRKAGTRTDYGYSGYGDIATLTLDNGAVVDLYGHDGGCACTAGCYELADLAALADVDNIITAVKFDASDVTDDEYGEPCGAYRVFVFAEDKRVQLASFEGDDGNGYYGTGYYVRVRPITQPEGADQ